MAKATSEEVRDKDARSSATVRVSSGMWFRAESNWELAVYLQIDSQWQHLCWDGIDHSGRPSAIPRFRPGTDGYRNYELLRRSVRYDCSPVRHNQRFKRDSYGYRRRRTGIVYRKYQPGIHGDVRELHCPARRVSRWRFWIVGCEQAIEGGKLSKTGDGVKSLTIGAIDFQRYVD